MTLALIMELAEAQVKFDITLMERVIKLFLFLFILDLNQESNYLGLQLFN